jgi:hypothetical protein
MRVKVQVFSFTLGLIRRQAKGAAHKKPIFL